MPQQEASSRCVNHTLGIVCTFCGASFGRQEHLTRHVRSHLNHRPFQCRSCDRRFSRSDALSRHVTTNCPANRRRYPRTSVPRASAACLSCARSKQRCPGGSPCQRCMSKGVDCVYPGRAMERRAKQRPQKESLPRTSSSDAINLPEGPNVPTPPGLGGVSFPEPSTDVHQTLHEQAEATCLGVNEELNMADMGQDWGNFSDLDWLLPFEFGNLGNHLFHNTVSPEELNLTPGLSSMKSTQNQSVPRVNRERPINESMYGMIQPSLWTYYPLATSPSQKPASSQDKARNFSLNNKEPYTAKENLGCGRPSLSDILQMDDFGHVPKISGSKVAELYDYIVQSNNNDDGPGVDLAPLRNQAVMNMFTQLYFEHFHDSLPLLHRVTFNPCEAPLILNLAVATIGSHYSRVPKAYKYTKLLGDCLRMSISRLCDQEIDKSIEIPFAQSVILSQIDTAYSGEREYVLKAQFQRSFIVTICRGTAAGLQQRSRADASTKDRNVLYQRWLRRELEQRIVYCGWLLDCQYSLHYDIPFIMTLDEIDLRIPCDEKTWDSPINELNVEELMISKPISPKDILASEDLSQYSIGELTRTICIACIYHQSRLMLQTCSAWFVSSQATDTCGSSAFDNPIYTDWRQWAVDKLVSLTQSSLRQPHHHLSITTDKLYHVVSILLYLPFKRLCASVGWLTTEASKQSAQEETSSWLGQNNGIHARRAVRHAAILFALFRTDSVRMYHGASSFLLATLTIWAYATLQPQDDCRSGATDSTEIYLDRKMSASEEEIWVSGTISLVPRIAGVGCIQGSQGARRLLLEACQILRSRESWGISRHLQLVFERLIVSGDALALQ